MAKQPKQGTGRFGQAQPGGRGSHKSQNGPPQNGAQVNSMGASVGKEGKRVSTRYGLREGRRLTTDPFTTHVVMEQIVALRTGRGLVRPKPDLAPRVFPGSRTLIGQPEKRLLK